MMANCGTINFRLVVFTLFNWQAKKSRCLLTVKTWHPSQHQQVCVSFSWSVSCACTLWGCGALLLPPMAAAGDLHVAKLLHPTVFAELRDQRKGRQ